MEIDLIKAIISAVGVTLTFVGGVYGYFAKKFKNINERIDNINYNEISELKERLSKEYITRNELDSIVSFVKTEIQQNEKNIEDKFSTLDRKIQDYYDNVLQKLEKELESNFKLLDTKVNEKIESIDNKVDYKIDSINDKIKHLDEKLDKHFEHLYKDNYTYKEQQNQDTNKDD